MPAEILSPERVREIGERQKRIIGDLDLIESEHSAIVFGLPCICDSPQLHTDLCAALRGMFARILNQGDLSALAASHTALQKRVEELEGANRWRPIAEIHEDYGPCVVIDIRDPGNLAVAEVCDDEWVLADWTHFAPIPSLTHEEAAEMLAALSGAREGEE